MQPQPRAGDTVRVRLATAADLPRINEIYNHYVLHSTCTYQEEPESAAGRAQWFARHGERYPVTVAEMDGQVVGWGSLSPYHVRSAYRHTVENSVYVHAAWHGRGIGARLLADLIARAEALGYRAVIAVIDSAQPASASLHTRHGFEKVGHFREIGRKFGRWLDVTYYERLLDRSP